ncbi:MAG: DUF3467 domain-containing protein [bacterium]
MAAVPGPGGSPGHRGDGKRTTEIKVRLPEQTATGVYANSMMVQHTGDEFVMDFAMVLGRAGTVVARVICTPEHVKRIAAALEDNIRKYEATHGPLTRSGGQPPPEMGFEPADGEDE